MFEVSSSPTLEHSLAEEIALGIAKTENRGNCVCVTAVVYYIAQPLNGKTP